jgi:hypothetical protein
LGAVHDTLLARWPDQRAPLANLEQRADVVAVVRVKKATG